MTSKGIGLRSRQVPPCIHVDPPFGAIVEEESDIEEPVQREASVTPQQLEFEDAIFFSELDNMENVLSSGGQLKFTGDPGDVGDIAIRLEKAQGEESLLTTSKPASTSVLPSVVSSGSSGKSLAVTCYNCGRTGHMKNRCPYKNSKPTKKAVTNARSIFANPKANRFDNKRCYICNKHGHIARECPQRRVSGNMDKPMKEKPWCTSYHKINTHSSESCWAMHPELRPFYHKERAAQSARQAKVVPAKSGNSLNVKPKPALLSATNTSHSDASQTMDSYYAEEVVNESPHHVLTPFAVNAQAARVERRSAET
jgi:hypothetical protein